MKSVLFVCALCLSQLIMAQEPVEIVQQQLDAYNARNLDAFIALFSADAEVINYADGNVLASGIDEIRSIYKQLFDKSPHLHSDLTNRISLGNKVIDHETITGRMGNPDPIELVVIYEITNQKISRATVIRP